MAGKQIPRKTELMARVDELRDEDRSWADITDVLTLEGFKDAEGLHLKTRNLEALYGRWKKRQATSPTGVQETSPTTDQDIDSGETVQSDINPTLGRVEDKPKAESSGPPRKSEGGMTQGALLDVTHPTIGTENGPTLDDTPPEGMAARGESGPTVEGGMTHELPSSPTDVEAFIVNVVRRELGKIVGDVQASGVQKSGRGGQAFTTKKSFSLPSDLWEEFEKRFKGSIASNHVAAALRLYLRLASDSGQTSGD